MDPTLAGWLASPDGRAAIAAAAAAVGTDPLARATDLRRRLPGLDAARAAAALEQADLARRPGAPAGWLLTRDGLEQGTRPAAAAWRAGVLAAALGTGARVVDATAGLGFDASAMAAAGLDVTAVERDPAIAALLAANVPAARVVVRDAIDAVPSLLDGVGAVLVDPARRVPGQRTADGTRARSERDPARWSPPLPWALALAGRVRVTVKASPAVPVPPGWQAAWVSADRALVECALWSWTALPGDRGAVVVGADGAQWLAAGGEAAPEGDPGPVLLEPDPAVVAAGALDALAATLGARRIAGSPWLTAGAVPGPTPFARAYAVVGELPAQERALRAALRERGIANPTVKTAGAGIDAHAVRRSLGATAGTEGTVVLLRAGGRLRAYLVTASR